MPMLTMKELQEGMPEFGRTRALYWRAFPKNERRPWKSMANDPAGDISIQGLWQDGAFCGFAILMTIGDICHILYFAMLEKFRDQGLGTAALELVRQARPGMRIIVDIEKEVPEADNNPVRRRRKAWYLRCGYRVTGVEYDWQGEYYEILCQDGTLTEQEFWGFWKQSRKRREAALAAQKNAL